jgi:plasmid stabilization system protein ParE
MKVRITRPALDDLERINAYISKEDPTTASRVVRHLIDRAMALADMPYQGREVDEPNARVIVVPRFRYSSSTPSIATKFTSRIFGIRPAGGLGMWSSLPVPRI